MAKNIIIGSDHAGFSAKESLKKNLEAAGLKVEDCGTHTMDSVDFSPIAQKVAEKTAADGENLGILICGTGIGMSIMANKVKGIRAALVHDLFSAKATREHNNSNVLCMGARVISEAMIWEIAKVWLSTEFLAGKHKRRITYIADYENKSQC